MGTNEINNNILNLKNIIKNKSVKKFLKANNLLNQLSNKSLFMVTNNGIKIDIDGDGSYDKQINCVFDNNGNISKCNEISDIQQNQPKQNLAQILNNLYANLGFNFSLVENPRKNEAEVAQNEIFTNNDNETPQEFTYNSTKTPIVENREKHAETNLGFANKSQPPTTSMENLQQSIQNLNLSGVKVEIVNNFRPQKN